MLSPMRPEHRLLEQAYRSNVGILPLLHVVPLAPVMIWNSMQAIKVLLSLFMLFALISSSASGQSDAAKKAVFLGFRFIENAQPMTREEGLRLRKIENSFIAKLEKADRYEFVMLPDELRERIKVGQPIGECAGCEIDYGKELGVPVVMWGTVQKVSNLILNLNVYIADVDRAEMTFVKSVDMRGNSDLTWEQALNYLVKRYILDLPSDQTDKN